MSKKRRAPKRRRDDGEEWALAGDSVTRSAPMGMETDF
jgi:hypothetical protein